MTTAELALLLVGGGLALAAVGSFMCVVIDRLPVQLAEPNEYGETWDTRPWPEVVGGRSRCSSCGTDVRARENVPVVSWLLLRGRCRHCGDRIPAFHPVVELAVPAFGLAIAVANWGSWALLPCLVLVGPAIAIAVIDLRTLIVPTRLVWPTFAVVLALSVVAVLVEGEPRWLLGGLVGIGVLSGPLFVLWWINPKGMGFGDVRLTVLLGWTVGFAALAAGGPLPSAALMALMVLVVGAVLGILHGVAMLGRQRQIPFGPSLVVASLLALVFTEPFVRPFL